MSGNLALYRLNSRYIYVILEYLAGMSSTNQTTGNLPLNCTECNETVRKTPSGTYVCTGCGRTSSARPVR